MKKTTFLAILCFVFTSQLSLSQTINPWQSKSKTALKRPDRKTVPDQYQVFSLNIETLRSALSRASKRDARNNLESSVIISFPLDNGASETFSIERVSVLHPDLEAKFTDIRSYYGVSVKNPLNKIFISMDHGGFTGLITGEKTIYIDPYNFRNNGKDYIVYDRAHCSKDIENPFICQAEMKDLDINLAESSPNATAARNSTDGKLRTYRIAVAVTSEYSAYFGNTVANSLAAINTTITRVNSIYRNDFATVFQVVASNSRLIYINNFNTDSTPDPDPYDNYNGSTMLNANTGNITGLIGVNSYDIGHVFSTGGGGIAGTGPCNSSSKGSGVTGIVSPQNDPFDIDYVCHEIGHQFGAGHTYYNACFGSKVTDDYEPGSGTTIMGYAGICSPNVQYNSDAYFHSRSIAQITASIASHTCEGEATISNNEPVVSAGLDYTIPKGTPFTLTGSATDSNTADVLTYCWEQFDANDGGAQPPVGTNTAGPVFRSFFATTSPSRTFPKMSAIVTNTTPTWEVLPTVGRTLNFRLTVRDNSTLGGQTNSDNSVVTVASSGPFLVTAPNTSGILWYVGESKTVTWDVAGTTASPVSTANVAIKLSTDGGYTYPVTILSSTPNDGSQSITVPNNVGKNMRIRVEAVGNIYFDISNVDFEIKANTFELTAAEPSVPTCKPNNAVFSITYTKAGPFSETTAFSVTGLPAGASAVFSPTSLAASGTVTMTVSGMSAVNTGVYPLTFRGISTSANISLPLTLKVFNNAIGKVTLASPSNGAGNQQTSTLLSWSDLTTASSYLVQISTNPNFSTITETATVTTPSYQTTGLTQGTINYWRVKPINACLEGAFSEVFVFQIANDLCKTYSNVTFENNDSTWETSGTNAVSARLNVTDDIMISDVNLTMTGTHSQMTDIKMQFSSPAGQFAEIYNRDCSGSGMNVTWDDSAAAIPTGCSGGLTGTKQPNQPLSNFNGYSALGTWILLATDRVTGGGGNFTGMSMTVCGKLQIVNNVTATVNSFNMPQSGTMVISQSKVLAAQTSATPEQLIFNITQVPAYGTLKLNGANLGLGGSFTQADINSDLLTYVHGGANALPDSFTFSVKGNNTALLGGQILNIEICNVTNTSSQNNVLCFGGNTGSATVVASGGTAPYTYSWSPSGGNAATASNLVAGNYTCTITDASGCSKDQAFTITQPTAAISNTTSKVDVLCFGQNTGSATVVASGGTGAYTYLWSPSGGNAATASNLAAGNYSVRITDANGCFKDQAFTISQPTAAISNTTSKMDVLCFGSNTGSATVVASGGTGAYTYLWSPSGGNAATASNLAAGNYSVRITDANGCFKDQAFTISQPTAAISNTVSQMNVSCYGENNGSATVNATGGAGAYTYLWSPSGGNAATASNLSPGNYSVRITDANGCFKDQAFTITQPVATIWNGATWSNGIPVAGTKAIFNSSFTSNGDLTACSIEVAGTAIVTVLSGHDFNITNKVTVAGTAQLIFQNNANLIQTDEIGNTGKITSNRVAQMRRQDYVYWSSPVSGQNLLEFSPLTLTNRFYVLDGPTNTFVTVNPSDNDFTIAKGYMVRAPNTFTTSISQFDGKFTGVPNNGTKNIGVTATGGGFNMIGNPYPSTINAYSFLDANPGTLYFWTHMTQVSNGPSNYATFNTMGGTAAAAGGAVPNGTIQVGQGYLLQKATDGTAVFNNTMRTGNNTGQFFRSGSEKHRIWLNLNNSTTAFNQILIGYMQGATQGKDESIDGILIDAGTSISSKIGSSNFTIQGRALPFDINDVVPLHFNAGQSGNYMLSIDHTDGLFAADQQVYLKDNLLNVVHNIKQNPYNFVSDAGSFASRFEIVYVNATLGTNPIVNVNNLVVYLQNGIFNLKSVNTEMKAVKIFDVRGRLIYQKNQIGSNFTALTDFRAEHQVVLVQVECEAGVIITKKAVY